MFMLFLAENPMVWILIAGVIFLLFGGSKLPQLAKALGQSKRSFKEGLAESEDKDPEHEKKQVETAAQNVETPARNKVSLESVDDEALFAEAHRRARLQGRETKG